MPLEVGDANFLSANKLPPHPSRDVFLDDDESGFFLKRPGIEALQREVGGARNITHIFVYHRDRIARPMDVNEVVIFENSLRRGGISLVFSDKIAGPIEGRQDLGDMVSSLVDYYESGAFSHRLAGRIIRKQMDLVKEGASIGGRAPYGFGRFLVGPDKITKKLDDGVIVRAAGHRVFWLPDDLEKLKVWQQILEWYAEGWGYKRIANKLNQEKISSPDAGRTRTDNGIVHEVSGKWHSATVRDLVNNPLIAGIKVYGARSEGKILRWGENGARDVRPEEISHDQRKGRMITNSEEVKQYAKQNFDPVVDEARYRDIQNSRSQRSRSQRGRPRTRDLAEKPLSCRVIDLTNGCGAPMYCGTSGKKQIYVCSAYNQDPSTCGHHWVECEPLLEVTLRSIKHLITRTGSRELLIEALRRKSAALNSVDAEYEIRAMQSMQEDLSRLKLEKESIGKKLAVESDGELVEIFRAEFTRRREEIQELERELTRLNSEVVATVDSNSLESKVSRAVAILDDLLVVTASPEMRRKIHPMFVKLGIMVGVNCVSESWGARNRTRVAGGVIAFGNAPLPVPMYGKGNREASSSDAGNDVSLNDPSGETNRTEVSKPVSCDGHHCDEVDSQVDIESNRSIGCGCSAAENAASEGDSKPDDGVAEIVGDTARTDGEQGLYRKDHLGLPRFSP